MAGFVSRDRGATYARLDPPQRLNGTLFSETTDPSVAFDRKGNAYYSFLMAQYTVGLYRPVVPSCRPARPRGRARMPPPRRSPMTTRA